MKYFFSLLLSIAIISVATAQDFKKVETNVYLKKFEEAKTEIDKALAEPKNQAKAEGYYWKSRIYAALFQNEATRAKYPTAVEDAHAAFQKYAEMDPALAKVKEKGADGYFDMYATSFGVGINSFKEKKYDAASKEFEKAVVYSDYIFKNKWASSQQPFDTTSILYCAYSFQNAQKPDDAVKYYTRLAESKVTGEGFADIYKYLVDYNTKKKNKEGFDKYMALGKEVYPAENWEDFEIEYIDQNYDLAGKTALYDEMDAAGTLTESKYLQFGDVFVSVRNEDGVDSATIDKYNRKAIDAFKKAYGKNNNNAIAAFNVGVTYYNFFNLEDDKYAANIKKLQEINASKPVIKDPKKKAAAEAEHKAKVDAIKNANAAIEKVSMENVDIAAEWLSKSFMILKDKTPRTNTEKSVINKSVDFIANIYYYKMGRVRGKDAKLFDQYEAKYKEFDALHSTFK
ncbi:MAG TPA: hypothetical protein VJA82_11460 [Sediminibacterium sp.]|uniref:hypothetical protein n=1 Tax=Sediminibacterium sp. TaxID=1917865 RepID=UPI000ADF5FA4|nr:hypothetical protein [Sediminibacterium sp.]HLD53915.1 hypothetical protein [Sediminibacterium sp.]